MGDPSFSWTKWSSKSCSSIALYIFTGALTSPKAMLPDQIARGMSVRYSRTAVGETSCSREERRTDPSPPQGRGTEDATPARQESLRRLSVHPFR